jgi:2',3'-cyclic-nucleotide 2'-phosphodiesterase (5'-nucleotidase family)
MGQPRRDAEEMDRWMLRGMALAEFDAINVSTQDVAGLLAVGAPAGLPLVSANLAGPGIARWRIVERGGLRIGITGVTGGVMPVANAAGLSLAPILQSEPTISEMASQVDVAVVLAWGATEEVRTLVRRVPGIDVVIDASIRDEAPEAAFLGGTLLAFSVYQGVQLGELRLEIDAGRVVGAIDRHVDLDDVAPEDPAIAALAAEAKTAIDRVQRELYGP